MIKADAIGPFDEVFTHIDDGTGQQTTYATKLMFDYCVANPDKVEKLKVPVEEHHANYCVTNRGAEAIRIQKLVENVEWLIKPILFVVLPDGGANSHLLVDGTHRYVAFHALGAKEILAYFVPWEVAKEFIVDIPALDKDAVMGYSYMTELRTLEQALKDKS